MAWVFHARFMNAVFGRVLPLPRERYGVVVDQFMPGMHGPIFQSAGNSKYLHQVTKETATKPILDSLFNKAVSTPLVLLPPALGALGTSRRSEPLMYIWALLLTWAINPIIMALSFLAVLAFGALVWGKQPYTLEDTGSSDTRPEVVGVEVPKAPEAIV